MSCPKNPRLDPDQWFRVKVNLYFSQWCLGGFLKMTLVFVGGQDSSILRVVKHVLKEPSMLPDPTVQNDAQSQCRGKFSIDPLKLTVHLIQL